MGLLDWFKQGFENAKPKPKMESSVYCVPASIAAAWSWTVKYRQEVRMAVQKIKEGSDHVQAQALINNVWTPLVMHWTKQGPVVRPGKQHFNVEPYRYLTLSEWVNEQIVHTELN